MKTDYCLMQVKNIAESILQYFWTSLSYHLSLRSLFCLFLSGRLRQVLLYMLNTSLSFWTIFNSLNAFSSQKLYVDIPFLNKLYFYLSKVFGLS